MSWANSGRPAPNWSGETGHGPFDGNIFDLDMFDGSIAFAPVGTPAPNWSDTESTGTWSNVESPAPNWT